MKRERGGEGGRRERKRETLRVLANVSPKTHFPSFLKTLLCVRAATKND